MLFFMRFRDKEYRVRVESRHGQTFVRFNDAPEQPVDLHYFGNDCSFLDENQVFQANVTGQKTNYTVWRPEGNLEFTLESEYRRIVAVLRGQELGNESNVYAKMPGKIVKLMGKVGQELEQGSPVLVMEAMKMENEIRAPKAGRITNICVQEGQAVETGTLLVQVEPSRD